MAAVSQKIPNLLGGVSQQPDPVKLPGQVREAKNVYLDPTFGCRKRPATKFVAQLANDIPPGAKWFPIFRDSKERYVACLYKSTSTGNTVIRVWDALDGSERTVTTSGSGVNYLNCENLESLKYTTISDYTLMSNAERLIAMAGAEEDDSAKQALVIVNQVSYNTTYAIDLAKDGTTSSQVKVYRATGIEIEPATLELEDGGNCTEVDAQDHTSTATGKTGLTYRIVHQCSAYLKSTPDYSVDVMYGRVLSGASNSWMYDYQDGNQHTYTDGDKSVTYSVVNYGSSRNKISNPKFHVHASSGGWSQNESFVLAGTNTRLTVTHLNEITKKRYVSRYSTDVILKNGGQGWRVGDVVTATQQGRTFNIRVTKEAFTYTYSSDGSASYTTSTLDSGNALNVGAITANLVNAVGAISGYTAEATGNVIRIIRSDDRDFNIQVRGGSVNKAMQVLKNSANDVSELPNQCWDGFQIKVANSGDTGADDYYVKFVADAEGIPGVGSWEETVKKGISIGLSSSTMPHALIREADGDFAFKAVGVGTAFDGWGGREVGDESTNPDPSFVGQSISNMFFYNNRLGFLSADSVVMSQPGDFFNFFSNSAIALSDADPIDLTASSRKPAILKAAIGAPKGLVLFAENSQFVLSSDDIAFGPSTVKLTEISQYFYKSKVDPVLTGISAAFISESQTYSKVMELAIDSVKGRPNAADITRAVPEYIPTGIEWVESSSTNSMIFYGDKSETIYLFKFFNQGDERKIAGWSKWVFKGAVYLYAQEADTGYIVEYDNGAYKLSQLELLDDSNAPVQTSFGQFVPRLDRYITKSDLTPSSNGDDTSTITLPVGLCNTDDTVTLITSDGSADLTSVEKTVDANRQFIVDDTYLATDYTVGLKYTSEVELPAIHVTKDNRADRVNVPMVEFVDLNLYYSARYEIDVAKLGYDTYTTAVGGPAANIYEANASPVKETDVATVPIFSPGDIVYITVKSSDPYPSSITSYSWRGHFNNRGLRTV